MGSEFLLLWLLSMLLFPSSSEANCILDDVHGEVLPNYDPFHIKWKIDYEQDSIDIFISSTDESLLNSREGYLALGLSEVSAIEPIIAIFSIKFYPGSLLVIIKFILSSISFADRLEECLGLTLCPSSFSKTNSQLLMIDTFHGSQTL